MIPMLSPRFKYETDEDKGYSMWFYGRTNPNTDVRRGVPTVDGSRLPEGCERRITRLLLRGAGSSKSIPGL